MKEATITKPNKQLERHNARPKVALTCLIYFLLAFLISAASYHGQCFIGGISFVGAVGAGVYGLSAFMGICIGYPLMFGFEASVHYIAVGLFVYTIAYIFQYIPLYRSKYFMPSVVTAMVLLVRAFGSVNIVRGNHAADTELIIELLLSWILTYLYAIRANDPGLSHSHSWSQYSSYAIFATALMSFSRFQIGGVISIAHIIGAAGYMMYAYNNPQQTSYPVGFMFGLALQHSGGAVEDYVLVYIFYSLSDVLPVKRTKLRLSLYISGVSALMCLVMYTSEGILMRFIECVFGVLLFLIFSRKAKNHPLLERKENKVDTLIAVSELMRSTADTLSASEEKSSTPDINFSEIFDRAGDMVCRQCEKRSICWKSKLFDIVSMLEETTTNIMSRGKLMEEDLPEYFRFHCEHSQSLVLSVNYELLRLYEAQRNINDLHILGLKLSRQCVLTSEILESIARIFDSDPYDMPVRNAFLRAEIGVASLKKTGERVCGDTIQYIKTEDDILYIILSDGIGTGPRAQKYSAEAVDILTEALRLLHDPIIAIELANTALSNCYNDSWNCATIDLASVNMNTGEIVFYKRGASDSYILTADDIITVQGNVFPLGSNEYASEASVSCGNYIAPKSVIIMASDGVVIPDTAMFAQAVRNHKKNMKDLAKELLLSLSEDDTDDRSLILVSLTERGSNSAPQV